jgi:hypothetical protein
MRFGGLDLRKQVKSPEPPALNSRQLRDVTRQDPSAIGVYDGVFLYAWK